MGISDFRRYTLNVQVALAILAICLTSSGCASGSGTSLQAPSTSGGQWLFVTTNNPDPHIHAPGAVLAFAPPFPYGPPVTITKGIDHPGSIATNAMGDLFVNNWNGGTIGMFSKPYNGQPRVLPGKFQFAQVALDQSGNLFALTNAGDSPSSLVELKPPYDKVLVRIPNVSYALSFALDSRDDVLMNFYAPSSLTSMLKQYLAPTYTKIGATLKFSERIDATGVNANDQLFVLLESSASQSSVAVYAIKQQTIVRLHKPFRVGCGAYMAVPARGDVFVSNICSSGIYEIASPAFGYATMLSGLKQYAGFLAVDSAGNLYIAGGNDVWISEPPYNGVTSTTPVNYDGQNITGLALGPAQF